MKKNSLLTLVVLFLLVSLAEAQVKDTGYEFPVQPGSAEWRSFKTGQEMASACQIPPEILAKMSTESLLATYLSYPLISTMYAHNNLQAGFDALALSFNGLQELLQRGDAGQEVIKLYLNMSPGSVNSIEDPIKRGELSLNFTYIELLLAQPSVQNKFTANEKKVLLEECLSKLAAKGKEKTHFGGIGISTTALVMGRLLRSEKYSKDYATPGVPMQSFLNTAAAANQDIISQIITDSQNFIKQ